nr:PREDICTED: uncharacterized protein CG1785 [Bemisia tabaci]
MVRASVPVNPEKASKTKVRAAKRSKKAWRKTDSSDVDAFLEDKRLEERLGKPFSERTDDELFQVDTAPAKKSVPLSVAEKKRKAFLPPKCFEILEPDSAVSDPITKRNRVRTKAERQDRIAKSKEEQRKKLGLRKRKEIDSIKQKRAHRWQKKKEARKDLFKVNPWIDENDLFNGNGKWLETDTKRHNLTKTGKVLETVKTPASVQVKPSILPPLPKPHPGTSYNPTLEDHNRLLQSVAEKEMRKTKKEIELAREVSKYRIMEPKQIEEEWMDEMMQGLDNNENNEDESSSNESSELRSVNKPVTRDRKKKASQRQRKKEHERKQRETRKKKLEKRRLADLDRVKSYSKLIDQALEIEQAKQVKLQKRKAIRDKVLTKRLSKNKFVAPAPVFSQREDITGNLRTITPVGNIAAQVLSNLQKRNMIEVTQRQLKSKKAKKKNTKTFKKRSHVLPTK